MENISAWIPFLSALGGFAGMASLALLPLNRRKLQADIASQIQQTYSRTISDLEADINRLRAKIEEVERSEAKCSERNRELLKRLEILSRENKSLLDKQSKLKAEINALKRRLQRYEKRTQI
jgi:chromosome segregation ATPase